jgi:DNA-binding GntR family transcriptional regulator
MVIGEWGEADPWAAENDDAYASLLAHLRTGPRGPVPVELDALAWEWGASRGHVRAAAARLEDLGILTRRADGGWQYEELSDADLSDALDFWVALVGPALRATIPALTPELRDELERRTARASTAAALRLPEYPTAFSAACQFWFEHSPNTLVRDLGLRAFERMRWSRVPTRPWSVHEVDPWFAATTRAVETGDPAVTTGATEIIDGLFEVHRRNIGIPRTDRPAAEATDRRAGAVHRALLRDVRSGALPAGSTHSLEGLVARTGAPPVAVLDAIRWLHDLGLVESDGARYRVVEPSLATWRDTMELLTGVFAHATVHVLPGLDGTALDDFRRLVERARADGQVRDHRYTESAFAVTRFLSERSGNRWTRETLRLVMARLAYALPEAPTFRQWDAEALWLSLDAAAGSGDVATARLAARLFVDVGRAHVDDVTARWGTMGS